MAIDLSRIGKLHVGLVGATSGMAYATQWAEPRSVLLGGAVMGANFYLLQLMARLLSSDTFAPEKRGRLALGVAAFVLKFGLFLGLLAALFWRLPVEAMSFALGVTLLLVACVLEAARYEWSTSKGVQ